MSKREGQLKSQLWKRFKDRYPNFYRLQYATAGAPDSSLVGNGKQTNWEFKHATPGFESPGNQELICQRIAEHGSYCRYVIWVETGKFAHTLIVHPKYVASNRPTAGPMIQHAECMTDGIDHDWLINRIREAHE